MVEFLLKGGVATALEVRLGVFVGVDAVLEGPATAAPFFFDEKEGVLFCCG